MKITRTICKASYEVAYYNKALGGIEKVTEYDTDNLKPAVFEKILERKNKDTGFKLCDMKQIERLAFRLVLNLEWDGATPVVTVESLTPVELPKYSDVE